MVSSLHLLRPKRPARAALNSNHSERDSHTAALYHDVIWRGARYRKASRRDFNNSCGVSTPGLSWAIPFELMACPCNVCHDSGGKRFGFFENVRPKQFERITMALL